MDFESLGGLHTGEGVELLKQEAQGARVQAPGSNHTEQRSGCSTPRDLKPSWEEAGGISPGGVAPLKGPVPWLIKPFSSPSPPET
jgi:hypothetical protein